jgi:pimeloyl-ACP methyl ester carboxylesterase
MHSLARMVARPVLGQLLAWPLRRGFAAMGFPSSLTHAQRVHTLRMAGALDFEHHLANCRKLTQPCLVAWARDDRLVAPHIIEELVEVVPGGPRLCFETGGHNLQKTQAQEIGEALVRWLPTLDWSCTRSALPSERRRTGPGGPG